MVGVVEAARECPEIDTVLGAVHGMDGILNEGLIDLFREDPAVLERLRYTPSAALGTSRIKPQQPDLERALKVFRAHDIRYFFYIGGNDSQLACHLVSELAQQSDWEMRIIGVPKTIDNDLPITDNCPGYGSAARLAGSAVQFVARDAEAFGDAEVIEIMGRHAGWVTGATQVGRQEDRDAPHLVYLPEVKFSREQFVEDCKEAYGKYGYLVVAVSEGFAEDELKKLSAKLDALLAGCEPSARDEVKSTVSELTGASAKLDEFGHARLGGVAEFLAKIVEEEALSSFPSKPRCRRDRVGNLHRCFSYAASAVDLEEAYAVAHNAVERAANGETDLMITIERKNDAPFQFECETTSLMSVANKERRVPREWINERQNGVTEEFLRYCRPLMRGTGECMPEGLPAYPRLQGHYVEKKLEAYVRGK
jgi:6-phosphofructokinase 1